MRFTEPRNDKPRYTRGLTGRGDGPYAFINKQAWRKVSSGGTNLSSPRME